MASPLPLLLFFQAITTAHTLLHPMQLAHGAASLPKEELEAISQALGDLLGDPTWPQLHPRPCTDTPWLGLQCELAQDGRLHATRLHVGPDVASPPCKPDAKLVASLLLGLPYLKTLSLFGCFQERRRPVSLPAALFTNGSALEQLVLSSNPGLSGEIPASLSELRSLRVLSLSQNGLHGKIPKDLGKLATLQQLDLSYNNITGEVPEEIGGLVSLSILDLGWNRISGKIPASIGKLSLLQKVDLSYNHLTGSVPLEVGQLQELVLLDLGHNSLSGPLPASMSALDKLQYLLLQDNPLGTALPVLIGSLKKLQVLGLSGCHLTGPIPIPVFASLWNLTAVSLDRNRLDGPIPMSLSALPHLGQLNLSQNRLTGEIGLSSEFVKRLGDRLDVRNNKELCIGQERYGKLSGYLEAPPCAGGSTGGSNRTGLVLEGSGCCTVRCSSCCVWFVWCCALVLFMVLWCE